MAFCRNCGQKLTEEAKFCNNCGTATGVVQPKKETVVPPPIQTSSAEESRKYQNDQQNTKRQTVYDGELHKCPNCGEFIDAFVVCCPSCGYELRGRVAAKSVSSLYNELKQTQTTSQKDLMIRNFPIPNAKEDIIEFMILASSNILGEDERDIYDAWLAKFEQAYQKAQLLFSSDPNFSKIQRIYNNCQINIDAEKQRKISRFTVDTVIRNIVACIGIALMIVAVIIDRIGGNASLIEMVSCVVLIVSAASLFKRGASTIDYIVGVASGFLTLLLSFMLFNGSMGQLCGGIVLIIVAVNYFKSLNQSKK